MELRFLEKDLVFFRFVLLRVVLVRELVAAEVGILLVVVSLTGRKLSKTKGSFDLYSMDTLLGALVDLFAPGIGWVEAVEAGRHVDRAF